MARIRLPKIPTHKSLYSKKVDIRTYEKIDKIVEELDVSKWRVVDGILSAGLGIKVKNPLDLKKWLK